MAIVEPSSDWDSARGRPSLKSPVALVHLSHLLSHAAHSARALRRVMNWQGRSVSSLPPRDRFVTGLRQIRHSLVTSCLYAGAGDL